MVRLAPRCQALNLVHARTLPGLDTHCSRTTFKPPPTTHHHHPPPPPHPQKQMGEGGSTATENLEKNSTTRRASAFSFLFFVVLPLPRLRLIGAVVLRVLLWRVCCFAFSSSIWVLLRSLLSFWKVWPSPVLFWRGAAFPPPSLGRCRSLPLPCRWCYPSPLRSGGSPFPSLSICVKCFFSKQVIDSHLIVSVT